MPGNAIELAVGRMLDEGPVGWRFKGLPPQAAGLSLAQIPAHGESEEI